MKRVAFVHPDLGIGTIFSHRFTFYQLGGAERLIVDAAASLQKRGHEVVIYTSHYSETHCFLETKGTPALSPAFLALH